MPPAGHLHEAEIWLHRAPGVIPWGRKVSDPSSHPCDTTCFIKIMQQSGCRQQGGMVPHPRATQASGGGVLPSGAPGTGQ